MDLSPFFEREHAEIGRYGLISIFKKLDLSLSCIDTVICLYYSFFPKHIFERVGFQSPGGYPKILKSSGGLKS